MTFPALTQPARAKRPLDYAPGLRVLAGYSPAWLRSDLVAGATVFAVLVPSALAYGDLAGLAPIAGLYAAAGALVGYALFGSSRQAVLGPDATLPLMMAAAVAPLAAGDAGRYAALAALSALLVGLFCAAAGLLRLGFIANYLSQPILTGYMAGVSLMVIAGQLGRLFGVKLASDMPVEQVAELLARLGETHWLTLGLGLLCIVALAAMRRRSRRIPGPLIVMLVLIALSLLFGLEARGVAVVGRLPAGLPRLSLPAFGLADVTKLLVPVVSMALIAFADTLLNSRAFAARNGYKIDADQELIGLGAANLGAGLLGGFPVSSSSARTAVADSMGGQSQVVGLAAAALCLLFLLFFAGAPAALPLVVLAAVLIVAVWGLIDFAAFRRLWQVRRGEFWLALIAAAGVVIIGLLEAILLAVVLSLVGVIARVSRPHDAVLRPVAGLVGLAEFRPAVAEPVEAAPGLVIYRFDAPLFFANSEFFLEEARRLIARAEHPVRWFLLDAAPISDVDATAADMLVQFDAEMDAAGIQIAIARATVPLRAALDRTGLTERIGAAFFFNTLAAAIEAHQSQYAPQPPAPYGADEP